jgi:hypothetical protein
MAATEVVIDSDLISRANQLRYDHASNVPGTAGDEDFQEFLPKGIFNFSARSVYKHRLGEISGARKVIFV